MYRVLKPVYPFNPPQLWLADGFDIVKTRVTVTGSTWERNKVLRSLKE